jgi:hypothetical protein
MGFVIPLLLLTSMRAREAVPMNWGQAGLVDSSGRTASICKWAVVKYETHAIVRCDPYVVRCTASSSVCNTVA